MLLKETEHLQSALRIRISRKEVLQDNEQEIEKLRESISSICVQLLEIEPSYIKSTQTVLSSNGSICEAQDDYNDPVISFKKGKLLQLSTNGHEVQSLETGQKSAVPMKYIGYSRVELLNLFQFAVTKEGLSLLPVIFDDDKKVEHFILKITNDFTILQSLRELITMDKLFMASYNFEGLNPHNLTLKKGEILKVAIYKDDGWWYMHSLDTNKEGYVSINYILPIEGKYSPMYYKYIYYHTVSRREAEERLNQADTQAGTFLIRDSESKPGQHYSLSVNNGVTIKHYRIYTEFNKYYINPHVQFDSLNDLVHHYMIEADGLTCSLTVPIPKQANIPIAMNKELEINKSQIKFSQCINAGWFGETWKGDCKGKGPVTIKTNIATDITQKTFLDETNILVKFYHKNIISLYGACTESYPFYIVTEPMNENLKDYLISNNTMPANLVDIAIQATDGMIYLGEQDYIHCDLRAENILLGDHNIVKIANFDLAQHLNGKKYQILKESTKVAIKWTAPEGYTLSRLSIKSDVWSFGILLWELATKGKEPYPGMTDEEVKEAVSSKGYHMPIPQNCPKPFKQLMPNCWKIYENERPNFRDILVVLVKHSRYAFI
ncbi:PREDICTED: tyrosine-protein kinase SRK2-like [Amphimedon queenslandica]|nr:PREDICTED: tyrosine-protein kinase SRK2-like [Amphimedon queenslandica]|eukprot:XP_019859173.1 PREDICTED: tyrosine-protein kinase SRK2-like [Amphimedon queenslandica]